MSWSWTKILKKIGWTTWYVVLSSARPLFCQVVPSYSSLAWSCAKFIFPALGKNLSITLNYLPFIPATSACHVGYLKLCNKEDLCVIKKIVGDTCSHVSLLPSSYSRISGRDSCKGGRFVTAPVWHPKIWAKFSFFALQHCIMALI